MRPTGIRVLTAAASAAAVCAVLAGCDASSTGEGSGNGAGGPTSTGPMSSAATPVPTIASPDAGVAATLVTALRAIDPALAISPDTAVANAVSLCAVLREGEEPASAVASTFPDVDLDTAQQQAVAAAVTSSFCALDGSSPSASESASPTASASASASAT